MRRWPVSRCLEFVSSKLSLEFAGSIGKKQTKGSSDQVNRAHLSKTRVAGESIKPWDEAKRNPRLRSGEKTERAKRAIAERLRFIHHVSLSPASRALASYINDPGVPLRSTPGFMLSPRFAGHTKTVHDLSQLPLVCTPTRYLQPAACRDWD